MLLLVRPVTATAAGGAHGGFPRLRGRVLRCAIGAPASSRRRRRPFAPKAAGKCDACGCCSSVERVQLLLLLQQRLCCELR